MYKPAVPCVYRFIVRNWSRYSWKPVHPKSAGWAGDPGELMVKSQSKSHLLQNSPLTLGRSVFCCIQAISGLEDAQQHWGEPLAFLSLLIQAVILPSNTVTDIARNSVYSNIFTLHEPAKKMNKISHHKILLRLFSEHLSLFLTLLCVPTAKIVM